MFEKTIDEIQQHLRIYPIRRNEHFSLIHQDKRLITPSAIWKYFAPFNEVQMAKRCSKTKDTTSRYYQKSVDDILAMWHESRDISIERGHTAETYLQAYFFNLTTELNALYAPIKSDVKQGIDNFIAYFKDSFYPVAYEVPIVSPEYSMGGIIDFIALRKQVKSNETTVKLIIIDWKTNSGDVTKSFANFNEYPLSKYAINDVNKASIQVAWYSFILEQSYNFQVDNYIVLLGESANDRRLKSYLTDCWVDYESGDNWIMYEPTISLDNNTIKGIVQRIKQDYES